MLRFVLLSIILLFRPPSQDVRVLTYSSGKLNTNSYEGLSFWIKDNKKAYIRYAHGVDAEDLDLSWAGPFSFMEEKGFKAQFPAPDNNWFYIIPQATTLKVMDKSGKYLRFYSWENEAQPGDPAGCSICAKDEKEAMELLRKYFMQ